LECRPFCFGRSRLQGETQAGMLASVVTGEVCKLFIQSASQDSCIIESDLLCEEDI